MQRRLGSLFVRLDEYESLLDDIRDGTQETAAAASGFEKGDAAELGPPLDSPEHGALSGAELPFDHIERRVIRWGQPLSHRLPDIVELLVPPHRLTEDRIVWQGIGRDLVRSESGEGGLELGDVGKPFVGTVGQKPRDNDLKGLKQAVVIGAQVVEPSRLRFRALYPQVALYNSRDRPFKRRSTRDDFEHGRAEGVEIGATICTSPLDDLRRHVWHRSPPFGVFIARSNKGKINEMGEPVL